MFRKFFQPLLALTLFAGAAATSAQPAAPYPSRPVKLVVPYSAGGPADMLARMVADKLATRLGQPVLIDNRPGVGGHTGGEFVANAPADGYTLMLGTIAHNGAAKLFKNLRYDPANDLQPVILIAESPSVLLVNQNVPARSVGEVLALARSKPGQHR
jgi:tripartite-type tricarboxylate transporter receptor subunit TctC